MNPVKLFALSLFALAACSDDTPGAAGIDGGPSARDAATADSAGVDPTPGVEAGAVDAQADGGQTPAILDELVKRMLAAHATSPSLRFTLTLAVLAANDGSPTARSLGAGAPETFNVHGANAMASVKKILNFTGAPSTWPSYLQQHGQRVRGRARLPRALRQPRPALRAPPRRARTSARTASWPSSPPIR